MLLTLKSNLTQQVIFTHDCLNNTLKTTLEEAVKKGVKLMYTDFSNADLRGAQLDNAYLYVNMIDTDLRGAHLSNACICGGFYSGANFEGADLSNAAFIGVNLAYANFKNANLANAYFFDVDLTCANFDGANLTQAGFTANEVERVNFKDTVLDDPEILEVFKKKQIMERIYRNRIGHIN